MISEKYSEFSLNGLTVAYYIITSAEGFGLSIFVVETGESFTADVISKDKSYVIAITDKMVAGTVTPVTAPYVLHDMLCDIKW